MNAVERYSEIIRNRMQEQMEISLKEGQKLIDSELDIGLLDFIVKPMIKSFYQYWSHHDVKEGTLKQIEVTLKCGKLFVNNGKNEATLSKIIEEHFNAYLEGDQTSRQCKKTHKNYNKLKELTKLAFISQVKEVAMLLSVKEDESIETYEDLIRETYKTKQKAHDALIQQLYPTDEGIKIVEKDPSILKVPTGKNMIVKILRKGFINAKKDMIDNLDLIFD